jgi:hypothetical protein
LDFQTEDKLQVETVNYLRNLPIVWFHVPNGKRRRLTDAIRLKALGVRPGVADFILLIHGVAVAIELKNAAGIQSKDQKGFQTAWEANGGLYRIARNVAGVAAAVDEAFAIVAKLSKIAV